MENERERPKRSIAACVVLAIVLLFILVGFVALLALLRPAIGNVYQNILTQSTTDRAVDHLSREVDDKEQGQLDLDIDEYTRAIALDPQDALAYLARGAAYQGKGDLDRAIADYDQAIELDPQLALAYNNRGAAYAVTGQYDPALDDLSKAIEIDSSYANSYAWRGMMYAKAGEQEKAIYDLEQALELGLGPDAKQMAEEFLEELGLRGETFPEMSADHVPEGTDPGPYNSDPPTSGRHYDAPLEVGFYEESDLNGIGAYPEGFLVHNLEHGYVIFWYNCAPLDENACLELKGQIQNVMQRSRNFKVIGFPRDSINVPVVMTSWTRMLRFDEFDVDLAMSFVRENRNKAPEPSAP